MFNSYSKTDKKLYLKQSSNWLLKRSTENNYFWKPWEQEKFHEIIYFMGEKIF